MQLKCVYVPRPFLVFFGAAISRQDFFLIVYLLKEISFIMFSIARV